jgi:hypothetical protein
MATAVLHALWSNSIWRAAIFLAANVLFVAAFTTSPQALLPYSLFLLWGYISVRSAQFVPGQAAATLFVVSTLVIFCWLKKYWFLSAFPFLSYPYLTIGLSYSFFRIMGMIIDARDEGLGVSVNKLYQINMAKLIGKKPYKNLTAQSYYRFSARGLTCAWTSFCLICFWASGEQATRIVQTLGTGGMVISFLCLFAAAIVLVNVWEEALAALGRMTAAVAESEFAPFARAAAIGCLVFACLAFIMVTHQVNSDIIYQAF